MQKKWLYDCNVIMMIIIIILLLVISYGGGAGNLVEMTGYSDSVLVEIKESGKCDTAGSGWSWMEVAFVVIGSNLS